MSAHENKPYHLTIISKTLFPYPQDCFKQLFFIRRVTLHVACLLIIWIRRDQGISAHTAQYRNNTSPAYTCRCLLLATAVPGGEKMRGWQRWLQTSPLTVGTDLLSLSAVLRVAKAVRRQADNAQWLLPDPAGQLRLHWSLCEPPIFSFWFTLIDSSMASRCLCLSQLDIPDKTDKLSIRNCSSRLTEFLASF